MKKKIIEIYEYHSSEFGFKLGDVCKVDYESPSDIYLINPRNGAVAHFYKSMVVSQFYNREYLQDFVYKNKIKTTLVSKYLGYSKGWLSQTMNRTDRGDLTEDELQDILKMLHVDWSHTGYVYVKATSTHAAYKTRPCVYEHQKHKDILQRAFWNGEFVHG